MLPRFPTPFLDGLLECLPLHDVLALTSVDKREALGRKHVIAAAAMVIVEIRHGSDSDKGDGCAQFLGRHPACRYHVRILDFPGTGQSLARHMALTDPGLWTRITHLSIHVRETVKHLPPHLRVLTLGHDSTLDPKCTAPDCLESLWSERWCPQFRGLTRLSDLTTSADALGAKEHWPLSVTRLLALWPMSGGYTLKLEAVASMTRLVDIDVFPDACIVQFPTSLRSLRVPNHRGELIIPSGLTRLVAPKLSLVHKPGTGLCELHVECVTELGSLVSRLTLEKHPQWPLPEGITFLAINNSKWINGCEILDKLPSTLKELRLTMMLEFDWAVTPVWPSALRTLHINAAARPIHAYYLCKLPAHLESLTLAGDHIVDSELAERDSSPTIWPKSLRYLCLTMRSGLSPYMERNLPRRTLEVLIVNGVSRYCAF
jgi:hypothetical protein